MADREGTAYADIGTLFFQDGYRLARNYTSGGISRISIVQLMKKAYESIDGLIRSFRNRCRKEDLEVDCHKGCTLCCHQAVLTSPHEILAISQYLEDHVTDAEFDKIKSLSLEKHAVTREMSAMQFLQNIHPCPFLHREECRVYPVRPMACRCYLSSSVRSCRDQHDYPEDPTRIAALYEFPLKAGRGMNEGIRSALMEAGLIPSEWLLETFLAAVIDNPDILDSWLAGNTPFHVRKLTPAESKYMREYYDNAPT